MVGLISVLACKTEARSNDVGDVVLYIYQIKNQFFCTVGSAYLVDCVYREVVG